jgi:hypothetical protein
MLDEDALGDARMKRQRLGVGEGVEANDGEIVGAGRNGGDAEAERDGQAPEHPGVNAGLRERHDSSPWLWLRSIDNPEI